MANETVSLYFRLFNEIGILDQLARTAFQASIPDGFLVSHFTVLNHLVRVQDGRTPVELARAFQVAKTTMTHTLTGLEKAGLVELWSNEDDGRSKRVWITDNGRQFLLDTLRSLGPELEDLKSVFPKERVEQLLPGLEELRRIMDERRD